MSSDAAPAAVPGPDDGAGTPTSSAPKEDPKGLLDSLLTPVPAARPASFNIDPVANEIHQEMPAQGASSSSYHPDGNNTQKTGNGSSGGRQETGVIRAWLLAGAERWRKGGDARLKRLDVWKARALARQIKVNRQISENRTGGFLGTGSGISGSGKSVNDKGLSTKNAPGGSLKGPKNSLGTSPAGVHGGEGTRDKGRGNQPASNPGSPQKTKDGKGKDHAARGLKGDGNGKPGAQGPAGKPGKDATAQSSTQSGKSDSGKKADTDRVTLGKAVASEAKGRAKDRLNHRLDDRRANPDPPIVSRHKGNKGSTDDAAKGPGDKKVSLTKTDRDEPAKKDNKGPDGTPKKPGKPDTPKTSDGAEAAKGTATKDKKPELAKSKDASGKSWTTQPAREAGYRDGARAARVTAQAQAYRDGAKDGWNDINEAAKREKDRLNKAHTDRKKDREKLKDKPVNATSADYHQPKPIEVTGIDAKEIHLGAGALKPRVSRGEVRNFVTFIARLEEKSQVMQKAAESTKGLQAEADTQADEVTHLLEDAKTVKGGDKLVAKLQQLADAARSQSSKAAEAHKRAVRAADACKALLANVKTRYEPIFKAVVNSPETRPAEMKFYRDRGYTTAA